MASGVHAESRPARVHLQWNRPAASTCINQSELEHAVEGQLGRSVFVAEDHADLRIDGEISQQGDEWVATLRVDEPAGTIRGVRELRQQGSNCGAINPSLIVVLALLIGLAQPHEEQAVAPPIVLGLAAAGNAGLLPDPTAGGTLWLGFPVSDRWLIWTDASGWLPVEQVDAQQRGGGFAAFQAGLSLCRVFGQAVGFAACGGGEFGFVHGQGRGFVPNRGSTRLLAQPSLEAAISLQLVEGLALRTSAALGLALARPSFFVEEPSGTHHELFRTALFNAAVRVGLILDLR